MTLKDIEAMDDDMIRVDMVASVLGCHPQSLREMIKDEPRSVGFNTCRVGRNIYVPRLAFLRWAGAIGVGE